MNIKTITKGICIAAATSAMTLMATSAAAQALGDISSISKENYKYIEISSIPESTIKEYAEKLEKAGMTIDDALAQVKAKGATDKQLSQLRQRFSRYLKNSRSTTNDEDLYASDASTATPLSTREVQKAKPLAADTLVFGYSIFNHSGLTFEPKTSIAVGDSYVIGVGDEIAVDVYGNSEQNYDMTVDAEGNALIPMVGPVKVGGQTLASARRIITAKLRRIHSDIGSTSHADIRVTNANPVTVSVMGEAHAPGTFTVSAAASLFNVLYLSGGPSINGTFRDIQLIRGGRIIAHLDIYDFLLNGKNDVNPSLADGDIVMIPTYAKRVEIKGEFKRNGLFEAKEGETVADMIRYAGGFTPSAMTDHVGLYRIGQYTTEYKDVTDPGSEPIVNGDILTCSAKNTARVDNSVKIEGAVFAPGVFEYSEGLTLKALIDKAGGITENAFLTRGVISRYKDDYTLEAVNFNVLDASNGTTDIELKANDIVTIASIDDMREKPVVTIYGKVGHQGTFDFRENMTIGDLVVLAGGLQEYAALPNVEVVRRLKRDEIEKQTEDAKRIETVVLTPDLSLSDGGNNFKLEPFDVVYIREYVAATIGGNVNITGAVFTPGSYGLINNKMRISELVERCGGFTSSADTRGVRIFRKFKVSDTERDIRLRLSALKGDTATFFIKNNGSQYEYVTFDISKAMENPGSDHDIILCDGDKVEVPQLSQTVRVFGQVQNPSNMVWHRKWRADDYIDAVGGFAPRAYKRKTYVVHANGESERVRHVLFFRRYPKLRPGSEVIVPTKPERNIGLPTIVTMSSSLVSMAAVIVALTK